MRFRPNFFKLGLTTHLHQLMNRCWLSTAVPQQFKEAEITTSYKNKGDSGDCNYRGILLSNVTGKVLAKIILEWGQRLADQVYPESQCDFYEQRFTTDLIFSIRQLQEKSREQKVYSVFRSY